MNKGLYITIFFLFSLVQFTAQKTKKEKAEEMKFGLQFKPIIPVNYFGSGPQVLDDSIANLTIAPKMGYSLGMVMRKDFTNLLSLETGINYIRRNYNIDTYEAKRDTSDHCDFGFVAYQIPVQGLVYIRLSENIYMNTSGGLSVDFYPSHVQSSGRNSLIQHVSLKRYWMYFSVLANIGFEWRTEKSGGFYLGASFVNPLKNITDTKIDYYYTGTNRHRYNTQLSGTFITIDLKYFIPSSK
ncbi:MAG: outer membrane beta-barrel protein [Flavobacteriales bacterium]|nr:outer membrane beta-barrel protein [Flavobacteriales bacterium]MCB9198705.1 outer membrane beta-barrel protein [Flavobacteriales bacterium]